MTLVTKRIREPHVHGSILHQYQYIHTISYEYNDTLICCLFINVYPCMLMLKLYVYLTLPLAICPGMATKYLPFVHDCIESSMLYLTFSPNA